MLWQTKPDEPLEFKMGAGAVPAGVQVCITCEGCGCTSLQYVCRQGLKLHPAMGDEAHPKGGSRLESQQKESRRLQLMYSQDSPLQTQGAAAAAL